MYGWLWRHLRGSTLAKAGELVVLVAAVVVLLFTVVYPWLAPRLPFDKVTVTSPPPESSTVELIATRS